MKAITRLYDSGLTRAEVADGIGVTSHMVGMYERHDRFPSGQRFARIVELAEVHGLDLSARDFLKTKGKRSL